MGKGMGAKWVVLTHFSQRYPKISPFIDRGRGEEGVARTSAAAKVVVAFNFIRVRPGDLELEARLTPVSRFLYPGEEAGWDGGSVAGGGVTDGGCGGGRRSGGATLDSVLQKEETKEKTAQS